MKKIRILPALSTVFALIGIGVLLAAASNGAQPVTQPAAQPVAQPVALEHRCYEELAPMNPIGEPPTIERTARVYTDADSEIIAKIIWAEARGVATTAEKAAVAWCILNRYDAGTYGDSIAATATAPYQFAYYESSPVEPALKELALDVLDRWQAEKEGETDVGRTLPADYLFFDGDGVANHFRQQYVRAGGTWDWSLTSPYEEDKQ